MSILGTVAMAAIGIAVPGAGLWIALAKYGKDEVLGGLQAGAKWLFVHPMAAVAIAAGLFGLYEIHERHKAEAKIPALQAQVASEHRAFEGERHAFLVEKASFQRADAKITDNNRRIAAAAAELDRERKEAAADLARADQRYRATATTVAALEADARDPKRKPCTISDAAKKGLDGL